MERLIFRPYRASSVGCSRLGRIEIGRWCVSDQLRRVIRHPVRTRDNRVGVLALCSLELGVNSQTGSWSTLNSVNSSAAIIRPERHNSNGVKNMDRIQYKGLHANGSSTMPIPRGTFGFSARYDLQYVTLNSRITGRY